MKFITNKLALVCFSKWLSRYANWTIKSSQNQLSSSVFYGLLFPYASIFPKLCLLILSGVWTMSQCKVWKGGIFHYRGYWERDARWAGKAFFLSASFFFFFLTFIFPSKKFIITVLYDGFPALSPVSWRLYYIILNFLGLRNEKEFLFLLT